MLHTFLENRTENSETADESLQIFNKMGAKRQGKIYFKSPIALKVVRMRENSSKNEKYKSFSDAFNITMKTTRKSENENNIMKYWELKEKIELKYKQILNKLETEESKEIIHVVTKFPKETNILIAQIKEKYEEIHNLFEQQKILEIEDLIMKFQK